MEAIKGMPRQQNNQDVQRLLRILTYVSKFIKNFSLETSSLPQLLKKECTFEWNNAQEQAFENLEPN